MPAFHNAEKYLLALMIQDRNVTKYVEQHLADQFNVDIHAALAAFLYAYYSQYSEMNLHTFLAMLDNEVLENTAIALSIMEFGPHQAKERLVQDYIRVIKEEPVLRNTVRQKREEMKKAEQAGDVLRAAEIATEIMTLERQHSSK